MAWHSCVTSRSSRDLNKWWIFLFMVSALDSGSSGPSSSPCRGDCVVFMARHFTLTVPLSTQVYKFNAGVTLRWTSIPYRVEKLLVISCHRNRDKLRPDGPLGSYGDFTYGLFTVPYFPWDVDLWVRQAAILVFWCKGNWGNKNTHGVGVFYFLPLHLDPMNPTVSRWRLWNSTIDISWPVIDYWQ